MLSLMNRWRDNIDLSKLDRKLQEYSRHEKFLGLVSGVINANLWFQKNNELFWHQVVSGFNIASATKLRELYEELYRLERAHEYYEDRVESLESKIVGLEAQLVQKAKKTQGRAGKKKPEQYPN